jgi:hypothetical protein
MRRLDQEQKETSPLNRFSHPRRPPRVVAQLARDLSLLLVFLSLLRFLIVFYYLFFSLSL